MTSAFMGNSYVYAILVDGVVRYIGKGKRRRAFAHLSHVKGLMRGSGGRWTKFYRKLSSAIAKAQTITIEMVVTDLGDADAYGVEKVLIGCAPSQLWNVHPGGKTTFQSLWEHEETSRRLRDAISVAHSRPEVTAHHSAAMKARWADPLERARLMSKRKNGSNFSGSHLERVLHIVNSRPGISRREIKRIASGSVGQALMKLKNRGSIERRGGHNDGLFYPKRAAA